MLMQAGTKLTEWLTGAQGGLSRLVSYSISLLRTVFNFFVGVIISIYLLMDEEKFRRQIKSIIYAFTDSDKADRVVEITRLTGKTFNSFIFGKFIDSLIIGVITYFVLMIMKMPYAPLISFVVGVTNMIPVFGPFIGAVPSIIILLIINPWKALEFAIFIFILQQIDGNIIGPRILGDAVGLPTLWVMFAIIVGGALFGAVGMFIGVPVFSVIYVLLGKIIENNLAKKEIDLQTTREIKMRQ
ncbi:MAG: AI-2E family transporter, partial [Solobacterium sp.]|nr:AI-2E family transporter [Solobacterium sp.]